MGCWISLRWYVTLFWFPILYYGSKPTFRLCSAGTESVSACLFRGLLFGIEAGKLPFQKTTSSIATFLLTMVLFPDVQKRVQAELDAVVGRKRLPTFEDRASLPYLEATIKESLRFHPPTPLGIAHRLVEDDVVQGKPHADTRSDARSLAAERN